MFTKNIDSILKKVHKIVQELKDVKDSIDTKVNLKTEAIHTLDQEKNALRRESDRATALLSKWEEMV